MTGLQDRKLRSRPDVVPSRHEDVWDYRGATSAGPGPGQGVYVEKVGLQVLVYPARVRSSGEFTQAVIHVTDVRTAVAEMRGRGVEFEEYDMAETRTEKGIARMPGGGEVAWLDSEGNLVGVVPS